MLLIRSDNAEALILTVYKRNLASLVHPLEHFETKYIRALAARPLCKEMVKFLIVFSIGKNLHYVTEFSHQKYIT